jgi:hypothetical protein
MSQDLTINPFTQLLISEEDCLLVSPKTSYGLKHLEISKSEQPRLYELFLDLSKVRLDFLDIENDLNDDERELLYDSGVLIEKENVPNKPLFACLLDEVEASPVQEDFSAVIVNPTFRFQPSSLANFNSWIQEKHLSPYQPSVWIESSVTKIEIGCWLSQAQADIVSQFRPGEKLPFEIDENLLSRLIAAEIVIAPETQSKKEKELHQSLTQSQKDFARNKYAVLRNILPPWQMKAMRDYYRDYIKQGFMPFGDSQVNRRYYQHNEPLAGFFHKNLTKLMSLIAGEPVKPSYVYAASYKEGADLKPHIDREACEFSFSFQVDYQPEQENHLSPWALYLSTKEVSRDDPASFEWENFPPDADDQRTKAVYLASGDCLAYMGCELTHYRYALPEGHQSTSLFFHYVPENFEGELR